MSVSAISALGRVAIVGAGPGDADLLTVKAVKRIQTADIIFYDALVSEDIKDLFPEGVPCIYVGKRKGRHAIAQDGINQALVDQAKLGLTVCRLKGGDPFIFGRGGEEALALRDAGIAVEVVPGISAANGCSAYAGIPLTHRGITQGCTFVTAHSRANPVGQEAIATLIGYRWPPVVTRWCFIWGLAVPSVSAASYSEVACPGIRPWPLSNVVAALYSESLPVSCRD